jgi:hypothetical protein
MSVAQEHNSKPKRQKVSGHFTHWANKVNCRTACPASKDVGVVLASSARGGDKIRCMKACTTMDSPLKRVREQTNRTDMCILCDSLG